MQTHAPELVPRRLFDSRANSAGLGSAAPMRAGAIKLVGNKGLQGYASGRVHNIAGGYPSRRSRGGNQYSWGREGMF